MLFRSVAKPTQRALLFLSRKLLFTAVPRFVDHWMHAIAHPTSRPGAEHYRLRIIDLLQTLRCVPRDCLTDALSRDSTSDINTFASVLSAAYARLSSCDEAYELGLVSLVLNLLWSVGNVRFSSDHHSCTVQSTHSCSLCDRVLTVFTSCQRSCVPRRSAHPQLRSCAGHSHSLCQPLPRGC